MNRNSAPVRIALAGNPNCGKTSLFNNLTGANQEVGNFPGVTVEYIAGKFSWADRDFELIDLPGTYSLNAYSMDEIVARNYLLKERPDLIVNVVDASNLDRQLYLTVQLLELKMPMIIVLNMMDIAERHGVQIDVKQLSGLLGVPVVQTQASNEDGTNALKQACADFQLESFTPKALSYSHELEGIVDPIEEQIRLHPDLTEKFPPKWLSLKLLEHDADIRKLLAGYPEIQKTVQTAEKQLFEHSGEDASLAISEARLGMASGIVMKCVKMLNPDRRSFSDRIDSVVCDRFAGPVLLGVVVYSLFSIIFGLSEDLHWIPLFNGEWVSPCGLFGLFFDWLGGLAEQYITNPLLLSLVRDAIIGGVGGVLEYVPLIFMMFLFIAILEDTGYIARVAFILDRILRVFGLQGKSILAMIISGGLGGGGCAVPGILATRTLREEKDRLVTIMVAPMMNCGAKFPLYALLIGAFFSRYQGDMMFLLWLLSWLFSMTAAVMLRKFVIKGEQTPFIMELPVYHVPTMRGVIQHTWMRTWQYIKKAGTVILMFSVLIWFFMYFPQPDTAKYQQERQTIQTEFQQKTGVAFEAVRQGVSLHKDYPEELVAEWKKTAGLLKQVDSRMDQDRLRNSFAGRVGNFLTPMTRLAGFNWQVNVALLGGFSAKEVVVGTLATAYSMGDAGDQAENLSLSQKLASSPDWSPLKAFALMVFVMLYAPCAATMIVIRKETGSWKWTAFSLIYSTTFAFVIAMLIYQIGMLFA